MANKNLQLYSNVDAETGENIDYYYNNAETGEPEHDTIGFQPYRRRAPFQVPKSMIQNKRKKGIDPMPAGISFGQTRPISLLLPAIIYCRWFLIIITIVEAVLHIWIHRQNKNMKNESVFFLSPFHAITSEFCAVCQNKTCMDTVGKMQQMRMHKFFKQCYYMKRIVT